MSGELVDYFVGLITW